MFVIRRREWALSVIDDKQMSGKNTLWNYGRVRGKKSVPKKIVILAMVKIQIY
jgi:hypothetical protein